MKKIDWAYIGKWYGSMCLFIMILLIASGVMITTGEAIGVVACGISAILLMIFTFAFIPEIFYKRLEKKALLLEKSFIDKDFVYEFKFTSNRGVFYIDPEGGRLGVIWKMNPNEFQLADLSHISDIHTNDGKQLNGTSLVSCQFTYENKDYKIYTLRVTNGLLSMKSQEVVEAVSKADQLCERLRLAQQNAFSI